MARIHRRTTDRRDFLKCPEWRRRLRLGAVPMAPARMRRRARSSISSSSRTPLGLQGRTQSRSKHTLERRGHGQRHCRAARFHRLHGDHPHHRRPQGTPHQAQALQGIVRSCASRTCTSCRASRRLARQGRPTRSSSAHATNIRHKGGISSFSTCFRSTAPIGEEQLAGSAAVSSSTKPSTDRRLHPPPAVRSLSQWTGRRGWCQGR